MIPWPKYLHNNKHFCPALKAHLVLMVNYLVIQKEDKFHFSFSKKTTLVPIILFKKDSRSKKFDLLPYLMQIVIDALVPVYQFFKDILINGI